jgi:hypothetical protein
VCVFLRFWNSSWTTSDVTPFVPNLNDGSTRWWFEFDFLTYIFAARSHRGSSGVGTSVAVSLYNYFLGECTHRHIYLDIFSNNVPSQRFFAKRGAKYEAHVHEKLYDVAELQRQRTQLLTHAKDGSFAAIRTPVVNGLYTRAFDVSRDMDVAKTALRDIYRAEGVDLENMYFGDEEVFDVAMFAKKCAPLTLVAVDAATDRVVGFVAATKTTLHPFGVDYGIFEKGELYTYINWAWTADDSHRRGIATTLFNQQVAWHCMRWVRSSCVAVNEQSARWHKKLGLNAFVSVYCIDRGDDDFCAKEWHLNSTNNR